MAAANFFDTVAGLKPIAASSSVVLWVSSRGIEQPSRCMNLLLETCDLIWVCKARGNWNADDPHKLLRGRLISLKL